MPSGSPEELNATVQSPSVLKMTWTPPRSSDINGIIQYYNVSFVELETESHSSFTIKLTSIRIDKLHPFHTYKFSVSAVTIGIGPSKKILVQMPEAGKVFILLH